MCTCNAGTGRVNETDVTLPCLGEYCAPIKNWLEKVINFHYHCIVKSIILILPYLHSLQLDYTL